jgi:hypothetical protein
LQGFAPIQRLVRRIAGIRCIALTMGLVLGLAPLTSLAEMRLDVIVESDPAMNTSLGLAELDALAQIQIVTATPWTTGVQNFTGPSLRSVLDHLQINPTTLQLVALNDYSAEAIREDIGPDYPIVATRINGAPIPVRGNGPFWIIFPYDSDAKYQTEMVYGQSVWQLSALKADVK